MLGGVALGLSSALSWSIANVSIQVSARRFGTFGALLWAQITGALLVLPVALLVHGVPDAPGLRELTALVVAGVAACVAYGGLFVSLERGQVAVVTPVVCGWAVVSVLIGALVFDAPLGGWAMLGVGLVLAGNVTLARQSGGGEGATPPSALLAALASAIGFGVLVPTIDILGEAFGRLWAIPCVWGAELVIGVPLLLRLRWMGERPRTAADWGVAGRTGLFEVSGFITLTLALGMAPVTIVAPVASLSTAFSVLLGIFWLRERLTPGAILGAAIASVGVVLVNL